MAKELQTNRDPELDFLDEEALLDDYEAAKLRANLRDPGAVHFYDHNILGRFLFENNICTHPILKEKERIRKKIAKLEKRLLIAGIVNSPEIAKIVSQVEPDFLPKTADQITVEVLADKSIEMVRSASVFSYEYGDLAKHDFVQELEKEISDIGDETRHMALREVLEMELNERQYVFLRDKILSAMITGQHGKIFHILESFYKAKGWSHVQTVLFQEIFGPKLFADPKFQQAATQGLVRLLVTSGRDEFYSLAEYLGELGLNLHHNRLKNAPAEFVSKQLEYLWKHDPYRYFQAIDELLLNGLTTPELLMKDKKVRLRTLQFLLYSFRQNKFRTAMRDAVTVITDQLKMFGPEELSPDRDRIIWMAYREACFELNQELDPELKKIYRQGRINRFGQEEDDQ